MSEKDETFWDTLTLEKFQDIIKNGNHEQFDYGVAWAQLPDIAYKNIVETAFRQLC